MLAAFCRGHQAQLARLARCWLAGGASAFGVWNETRPLHLWPPEARVESLDWCVAAIPVADQAAGSLRVAAAGGGVQARLDCDAGMIARLLQSETDLDVMTAEMVDTQDQLLALYDLTRSTRAHLDLDGTLALLAQESARLARSNGACAILSERGPEGRLRLVQSPAGFCQAEEALAALFREVQASGNGLLLHDGDLAGPVPAGLSNLLLEPVQVSGQTLAALGLMDKVGGFISPDIKLLRAIAEQAGAQIENVLLQQEVVEQTRLQTEMEVARSVQMRLLPRSAPKVEGLEIYGDSRPALQVGGDFFEFIQRPGHPITFALGDVSGKGMPAALLMAMSRTVIRNKARLLSAPTPESILMSCNEELYDDFTMVGAFATVFVAQYDPVASRLLYANAGHSPVIYCPAAQGPARMLDADGPPIGVLPVSLSLNQTLDFRPGDMLLVGTDGFAEARDAGDELFGYDRLLSLAESLAPRSAEEIAATLFETISSFAAGHSQDDDQTLIVIKCSPTSAAVGAGVGEGEGREP